ncbi:hypothetical protein JDV02_010840 [Purpureocillium takamizusanense]|uniref:Zn(2)-C6 fungal-type domain-containing protein n=1 Tax=Purpureocillium takamizusanense TaxID=2060973 RepID=A0A9Q8VG61_9HYPO|nr:uncharacterized protein JDV02_010840 [Purpureocillium takamizusanense]UNI24303.1 hypothetical protein JDV02_010840 [Purpureocillium takamizusanense]
MYKPAPPRPKKTRIVRTRTGCSTCRKRRTKCDEKKPSCGTCSRLGLTCQQSPPKFEFKNVSFSSAKFQQQNKAYTAAAAAASGFSNSADDAPQRCQLGLREDNRGADSSIDWLVGLSAEPERSLFHDEFFWTLAEVSQANTDRIFFDEIVDSGLQSDHGRFVNDSFQLCLASACETGNTTQVIPAPAYTAVQSEKKDLECTDESLSNMPAAVLPHRDAIHVVTFYMDVWTKQCLPALHVAFHNLRNSSPLITNIMVTLSACRLSRTQPQRKLFKASACPGLCFRPDAGHESLSCEHYGAAMRKMARWSHQDFDAQPIVGLAVLVLFCYLESSMGNFREFRLHSEAIKTLLRRYTSHVVSKGAELLAAWVEIDVQNWWRRAYFSTPDFPRSPGFESLHPQLEAALIATADRRAIILSILCESHRLNTAAILSCWDAFKDNDSTTISYSTSPRPTATGTTQRTKPTTLTEYVALLKTQSEMLNGWHAFLPGHDLPMSSHQEQIHPAQGEPLFQPLHFRSHRSAMNFAYYVTARVMQCTGPFESLDAASPGCVDLDVAYQEAEIWISILLRIAAGIDWDECIQSNVYSVGFTGLLLACSLRTRSHVVGLWVQNWLEERLMGDDFEEGNFPVFQILDTIRLINDERSRGWDVLALFQTVDDGGGSGKFGSYHSQCMGSLWVYGRCRDTGDMCLYRRSLRMTGMNS